MNRVEPIVKKLVSKVENKLDIDTLLDTRNIDVNNNYIRVYTYNKLNKELEYSQIGSARHYSEVAIARAILEGCDKEMIAKMLLVSLVHQFNSDRLSLKDYGNKALISYLNDIEKQLSKYAWFDSRSKYTYPFQIDFRVGRDSVMEKKLLKDPANTLIDIIIDSLDRYKLVLVEVNQSLIDDFGYKKINVEEIREALVY